MFAGLGVLVRLALRRDRVKLPLAIGLFVLTLLSMIPMLSQMYSDDASLLGIYHALGSSPAVLFMTGPMDTPTFGAFMVVETLLWWGLAIAFINTMLVVRHTRHNEEIGAGELLLSGQVHRSTGLLAAITVSLAVNVLIVLGLGLGLQLLDVPWSGEQSWLYAVAMGLFGLVWASIAAVVVQLVENGRSANSMLAALIGVSFVVRGIGDFLGQIDAVGLHQPLWLSSLSPFGWLQATRPLTESDWAPLLISIGFSLAATGLALVLLSKRDVGAGLLPSRRGRARASRLLATPLGLTFKLQKNIFIGWLAGVLAMVATIGALIPQMGELFGDSGDDSVRRRMIESIGGVGEMVPSFMSAMIAILALMVIGYALQSLTKLRSEESNGHLEQLLATRLSRIKWLLLHVGVVVAGVVVLLTVVGAGLAMFVNYLSDINVSLADYVWAGLTYVPVVLVFVAFYVLLFGFVPRLAGSISWLYFGFVAFLSWLGPVLNLPSWVERLSVMEYFASPPVEAIDMQPVVISLLVSLSLIVAGLVVWSRRDLIER